MKLWLQMEVLAVACKHLYGTFVITTSVNKVSKANIKFETAKRLGNMTG